MTRQVARFTPDSLVTPSPYHIPGYGGYIPQTKYKIGETFSKTTHEILTDKNLGSGNIVLVKIKPITVSQTKSNKTKFDLEIKFKE